MIQPSRTYVEAQDGGYRVAGTPVSLDSIVYAFKNGDTAEMIAGNFPVLDLEQVYGALTYYLANRTEIDRQLERTRAEYAEQVREDRSAAPDLYRKLELARVQRLAGRSDSWLMISGESFQTARGSRLVISRVGSSNSPRR